MKKIFIMLLMAFSAIAVNAQTAVQTSKVLDNTFFGIEGGVATPLDFDNVFPLNSTLSLHFGKWFSPVVGAEVEGTAWFGSHIYGGSQERFDTYGSHNAIRGSYVGLNGLVNLTNLFLDYNGTPRDFELSAVVGTGWIHTFVPNFSDKYNNHLGAKTGLDFAFNLGEKKAHTISIRPAVLWNLSIPGNSIGQLAFNKHGAQLYLGLGYTYHFKTSNGTHSFKLYDIRALNEEINRLKVENETLKNRKPETVTREVVKESVIVKTETNEWVVQFDNDSAELTEWNKNVLNKVGDNSVVDVVATATNVGTVEHNQKLSEERAKVVADYLKSRGVKVASAEGKGISEEFGRTARVTLKK